MRGDVTRTFAKSSGGQGYTGSAVSGGRMTSWNTLTVPSLNAASRLRPALPKARAPVLCGARRGHATRYPNNMASEEFFVGRKIRV